MVCHALAQTHSLRQFPNSVQFLVSSHHHLMPNQKAKSDCTVVELRPHHPTESSHRRWHRVKQGLYSQPFIFFLTYKYVQ